MRGAFGVPDRWEPLVFGAVGVLLGTLIFRRDPTRTDVPSPAQGFPPIIDPTTNMPGTLDPGGSQAWPDILKWMEISP